MNLEGYTRPTLKKSVARTAKESLIEDIANATDERNKAKLCRTLAIAANTLGWSDQDLHALYQKRLDPSIRNYSAFVWSRTKIINPKNGQTISPRRWGDGVANT